MRAATLLALIGVSRPIYHLLTSNYAIFIVQTISLCCCLMPTCILFHGPTKITLSVCMSACMSVCMSVCLSDIGNRTSVSIL